MPKKTQEHHLNTCLDNSLYGQKGKQYDIALVLLFSENIISLLTNKNTYDKKSN